MDHNDKMKVTWAIGKYGRKIKKLPMQGKEILNKLEKLGGKRVTANCISIKGDDLNKELKSHDKKKRDKNHGK